MVARSIALLALLLALLAGCTAPLVGASTLLVWAHDVVVVQGPAGERLEVDTGPHCAHAQVDFAPPRVKLFFDLRDASPAGILARRHAVEPLVPVTTLSTGGDDQRDHVLGPANVTLAASVPGGPVLGFARLEGEDLVLEGGMLHFPFTLQPGRMLPALRFAYNATQGDATWQVLETLTFQHFGRVPLERGDAVGCA